MTEPLWWNLLVKKYEENTTNTKSQGKTKWETAEENGHGRRNKRHI